MATPIDNWNYDQLASYINRIRNAGDDLYTKENLGRQVPGLGFTGNYYANGDPIVQMHNLESDLAEEGYKGRGSGWQLVRGADGSIAKVPYAYGPSRPDPMMLATLFAPFAAYAAGVGAGGAGAAGAGTTALPAGGMAATGTAAPWAATGSSLGTLGTGTFGATTAGVGGAMGTTGGAFGLGSGLAGVTAADLAAAGIGAGTVGGAGSLLESAANSAGEAATKSGGNSMWDTALDKGMDFATSKAGSALIGGLMGGAGGGPDNMTSTTQQQIDPRMASILYGANGNDGFLSQIIANQNNPQKAGMSIFGQAADDYLGSFVRPDMDMNRNAATRLRDNPLSAPTAGAAQINAPGQNNLNLAPAYQDMVYGAPGSNPFLTDAIQRGINQSRNAFEDVQLDATRNILENVLPGIRSGAVINGAMGSSRQGIAEGLALRGLADSMGRATERFGQGATDTAVAARAGAYDTDRNRALAATQGLGAQQYGVASQDAQMRQQTNLANQQSQLATNQLNSSNQRAGIDAVSGLLGQAYGYGANNDQYATARLGQTASLLSPFTGLGASSTQTSPMYQNKVGGALSGAMAGLGLWNSMKGPGAGGTFSNWLGNNSASTGLGWSDLANSF